jgi:hypothetical protein
MIEYLSSDALQYVPVAKIRALLFAAIARKAAAGQKQPPNRGIVSDITMVSVLLPYCDAMLVDNQIAGYLQEQPLARQIFEYGTDLDCWLRPNGTWKDYSWRRRTVLIFMVPGARLPHYTVGPWRLGR